MERLFASVIPKDNFLEVMGGSPDLYGKNPCQISRCKNQGQIGKTIQSTDTKLHVLLHTNFAGPFWVATTVIFVLFVTSSIVDSINAYINGTTYQYNIFQMTFAFGTIYTY